MTLSIVAVNCSRPKLRILRCQGALCQYAGSSQATASLYPCECIEAIFRTYYVKILCSNSVGGAEPANNRDLMSAGRGTRVAGERATVVVDIVGSYRTPDGKEGEMERREGIEVRLGEAVEPLPLLLDDVMVAMKEGEVCKVSPIPWELTSDLPAVPAGAAVTYTVKVHSFQRATAVWEMETSELLSLARQHKNRGTQLFKEDRVRAASVCYSRAAKLVTAVRPQPASVDREAEELQVALFLNLAACQLKLKKSGYAFENCSRVLGLRPGCVKALYRRGVAAMHMGDLARAEGDLREAGRIEPGNTAVQGKLRELAKKWQLQNTKLRDALKSMFTTE